MFLKVYIYLQYVFVFIIFHRKLALPKQLSCLDDIGKNGLIVNTFIFNMKHLLFCLYIFLISYFIQKYLTLQKYNFHFKYTDVMDVSHTLSMLPFANLNNWKVLWVVKNINKNLVCTSCSKNFSQFRFHLERLSYSIVRW